MRHGEICCSTDMIEIALALGRHVDRRYYADAERFGRNHLLESQFLSLDRLLLALERLPADDTPAPWEGRYSTWERVAARQLGGFASRPTLNDAFHPDAAWMMQCCHAAGTRGLYDLWRYAVEDTEARDGQPALKAVHLCFSVETPVLRVVSHEPAGGRLDVTAQHPCDVEVRLPAGTAQALAVSDRPEVPRVDILPPRDGYVRFHVCAGERVALYYPLVEHSTVYEVGAGERIARCTGYLRGETLMRAEPPGLFYPLYEWSAVLEPVQPALPAGAPLPSL